MRVTNQAAIATLTRKVFALEARLAAANAKHAQLTASREEMAAHLAAFRTCLRALTDSNPGDGGGA